MAPYPSTMLEPHTPPFLQTQPHVIVRGEGLTVWDSEGRSYLDATSGMFCTNLGYTQPRLVEAADRQMATLPFYASYAHRTNDVALALADDLASLAPIPMGRTLFANSGAEAIDSAIKLAWYYHRCVGRAGRAKIISHQQGYHGTTVAAGSPPAWTDSSRLRDAASTLREGRLPRSAVRRRPGKTHRSTHRRSRGGHRRRGPRHHRRIHRGADPGGRRGHLPPRTTTTASRRCLLVTTSCSSPTRSSPVSAGPDRCSGPRSSR